MGSRSKKVDAKLEAYDKDRRKLAQKLRDLIHDQAPDVAEDVKWSQPTFSVGGVNRFYLSESKDHVKFGLFEGALLPDPDGIVEGTGKKMRHVKIADTEALDEDAIRALITAGCEHA